MKIVDLDYLASLTADDSIILSGGISAVTSSSSFSQASPHDGAISTGIVFASAVGKTTYTRGGAQIRTLPWKNDRYIAVSSAQAFAYVSK